VDRRPVEQINPGAFAGAVEFVAEFALRLSVHANGSQGNRYGRSAKRQAENEVTWWELKRAKLATWRKAHPAPYVVELVRLAPYALDDDNLAYACKGVRDTVAAALELRSDREGDGARWRYSQEKTKRTRPRLGQVAGPYRVRVIVRAEREGVECEETRT
jgi:hypothetical protein